MGTQPDEIRAEIEATRAALTDDVDRLAEKTSPKRIAQRRWEGLRDGARRVTHTVMGSGQDMGHATQHKAQEVAGTVHDSAQHAADKVSGTAHGAADKVQGAAHQVAHTVRNAPQAGMQKTAGNPLAAGLIAFGAGLLAASLLPRTDAERQMGAKVADLAEPLQEKAQEFGSELKDHAREALGEVKDTARQAASNTADQAKYSGREAVHETRQTV